MVLIGMQAGREGVQPLQPVCQPVLDQKFQRPVGDRGLTAEAGFRKPVQNLVGAKGLMRFEQDFQRPPPHRSQPPALRRQPGLGGVQRMGAAVMVVMRREGGVGGRKIDAQCTLPYNISVDLLSHNISKAGIATTPEPVAMRHLSAAALLAILASTAQAAPPKVLADTPVAASLVAQVAGDLVAPGTLFQAGVNPHHYQMRPSDAAALQSADLLVWFGPELTPWLADAARESDIDESLQLLHVAGTVLRSYEGSEADHGGADHDHDHAGIDPHAWLNPVNAEPWLRAIAVALSRLDPGNAATYVANADAAATHLTDLDAALARDLAPLRQRPVVVLHDAYGYFTDHYDLPPAIAVSPGDATSPSAARLREVRAEIADAGARCAHPDYGQDPKLIRTVIEGSEARMGDALDAAGVALEPGPNLYAEVILGIAATLLECGSKP